MSLLTVNDVNVLSGAITASLTGVWIADLVIDQPDGTGFDAGTSVTIKAEDGYELKGTVDPDRTGDFLEAVHVRILGGAGGMSKNVSKKAYNSPGATMRDVLNGIAADAGETLSSDIDSSLLSTDLSAWNTFEVGASQALVSLLKVVAPNADWRIQADGKLWCGDETWPSSSPDYEVLNHDPALAIYTLGVASPSIMPGVDVDGVGKVARVEHSIDANRIRTHIWTDMPNSERGMYEAIASIVRQEIAGIDYFTLYDAKIVSQSSDGTTVDLQPGDMRLPGMSKVPLRNGVAATVCKVSPGTFVRIGWDRGNPSMPYACLWQGGETLSSMAIGSNTDGIVTKKDLQFLYFAINAAAPVPNDGGAALKAAILATLAGGGWSSNPGDGQAASSVVSVQRL